MSSILKYLRNIEMPRRSAKNKRRLSKRRRVSRRRMQGGWRNLSPADVNDTSMNGPMNMSLKQGEEYGVMHEGQHGGGSPLTGAPAFQSELLPESMVTAARTGGTLEAFREIQGMTDQAGGARRRRRRHGGGKKRGNNNNNNNDEQEGGRRRRKTRGRRKSRGRKTRGRRRRQGGGALEGADVSAPGMLLSGNSARHAEGAMNPEWQLAKNPSAFAPM